MSETEIKRELVQLLWPHGLTLAGEPYGLLGKEHLRNLKLCLIIFFFYLKHVMLKQKKVMVVKYPRSYQNLLEYIKQMYFIS